MRVQIAPSTLSGSLSAPPSKSAAHRLLLAAGLADGVSHICGVSDSQDMAATLDCLRALGATVERQGGAVTVTGADPRRRPCGVRLPCRESGSTLRFFLPLCLLSPGEATLYGATSLFRRPLTVYEELAREQGLLLRRGEDAVTVAGCLRPGALAIPGDISSQFVTGLLYALPLLAGDSELRLLPPVESRSYIALTQQVLSAAGIRLRAEGDTLYIPGGQTYRPLSATVEGDWSNAAFFLALQTLGHRVSVSGLSEDSVQGDRVCVPYLRALAAGRPTLSLADCPDLGPVLMAVAAACHGATFTDTRRLRIKESDRVSAMADELAKCGVALQIGENRVTVPATLSAPRQPLFGHNDHRIVMALSTLLVQLGGELDGAEAVAKSLPDYFVRLSTLGCEVKTYDA